MPIVVQWRRIDGWRIVDKLPLLRRHVEDRLSVVVVDLCLQSHDSVPDWTLGFSAGRRPTRLVIRRSTTSHAPMRGLLGEMPLEIKSWMRQRVPAYGSMI